MSDLLLQIGASNLVISTALALVAFAVHRTGRFPRAAHLLWLLVLVKLVTPSVVTLPVIDLSTEVPASIAPLAGDTLPVGALVASDAALGSVSAPAEASLSLPTVLLWVWLAGSAVVFAWSLTRIVRFHRLLRAASKPAGDAVQALAGDLARRLRMSRAPGVYSVAARVSPLVWWIGGRVQIVVPEHLATHLDADQLESTLAHELAHVKRGDHLVRWLEWLTCVLCWWNPISWWARKNLRANEEVCCDALVLSTVKSNRRAYASSLLTVVEYLSAPAPRPPALASGMSHGGSLERRLKMIVSAKQLLPTPRWVRALTLVCIVGIVPLGIARAGEGEDGDKPAKPTREEMHDVHEEIHQAVESGEITREEGERRWHAYLEKHGLEKEREAHEGLRKRFRAFAKKIHALVENGELTPQEAEKKMAAFRERLGHEHGIKRRWEAAKKEIEAAIERGDLTEEEGEAKLEDIAKRLHNHKHEADMKRHWIAIEKEIDQAVAKGEMTQEEARAKLAEARRRLEIAKKLHAAELELGAAVKHGKLTAEEAKTKMAQIREKLVDKHRQAQVIDWEGIQRRLEEAVERGDLTREEAAQKLASMRERVLDKRAEAANKKWDAIHREIEEAVDRGEMTREEANAKHEEIRKKRAHKHSGR